MRLALGRGGEGAGDAGGFAHGDRIARHAIASMGYEVTADASAGHHQAVDVFRDEGAERNVVRLHLHAGVGVGGFLVFLCGQGMDDDREGAWLARLGCASIDSVRLE